MPRKICVDPHPDTGSDSNSGLDPKRPKRTLQGALALDPRPGDSILVRMGTVLEGPQVLKTNGVIYDTYALGTERSAAPQINVPKITGVPNGIGITVQGQDNSLSGWDVFNADMGILIDAGVMIGGQAVSYSGNRLEGVRVVNFALAVNIKGSKTTLNYVSAFHGRMLRNTAITYVGANAFTIWKHPDYPNIGTILRRCYAEDCYATTPASGKPDGSGIEVFGGVEGLLVEWMTARKLATFCEVGFTLDRHETARDLRFDHCLVIDPNGRVLYVNDRNGVFGGDIERIAFTECTLIANDDKASPFFIGADHGDMSTKLSVEQCIVIAASQVYNAGAGTDWRSITRSQNVYYRPDGHNAGVPLINGDEARNPKFYNPSGSDYRLSYGDPRAATLGALGAGPNALDIARQKTPILIDDSNIRGSWHSVPEWVNMVQIADRYREAGMRVRVTKLRETFELQEDRLTWLKVS